MSIADDLTRLEQLRDRASLSADEFQRAKNKLLNTPYPTEPVLQGINGLRRSATDRWLGGSAAGWRIPPAWRLGSGASCSL